MTDQDPCWDKSLKLVLRILAVESMHRQLGVVTDNKIKAPLGTTQCIKFMIIDIECVAGRELLVGRPEDNHNRLIMNGCELGERALQFIDIT